MGPSGSYPVGTCATTPATPGARGTGGLRSVVAEVHHGRSFDAASSDATGAASCASLPGATARGAEAARSRGA
jgi:hypothetical protein